MSKKDIPPGYWEDAKGSFIPISKIKPIDKDRTQVVEALVAMAKDEQAKLTAFKLNSMAAVQEFIERSLAEYDTKTGGAKGNVSLMTFDGRYKVVRQIQDTLVFDERLQAAKVLVDECIQEWSKGSKAEIKALINDAFDVDQAGKINTGRVLGLRRLQIDDPRWQNAMKAIGDSMKVASSKPYIRFYERDEHSGDYIAIALDLAAV
ncbi:DUF3164 family protein [Pseudacidovorax intermedius]|uniref:Sulfate transporter n=1 Tax=Pseudacidovorax intermedius TaxID=433924 RepID=A0A147GWX2_9BURK|nr:DUF3164 family protein [Pseudacidovorax intermedius]KTT21882.1 sulfate transporter [Pseudacidovorax intermedius]